MVVRKIKLSEFMHMLEDLYRFHVAEDLRYRRKNAA